MPTLGDFRFDWFASQFLDTFGNLVGDAHTSFLKFGLWYAFDGCDNPDRTTTELRSIGTVLFGSPAFPAGRKNV